MTHLGISAAHLAEDRRLPTLFLLRPSVAHKQKVGYDISSLSSYFAESFECTASHGRSGLEKNVMEFSAVSAPQNAASLSKSD
jgi:hypothetical protein